MIKTLTDHFTGEKLRIATNGNPYLPCFGEDGVIYMWLTNLYYWDGVQLRDDCKILDLKERIGLKPMKLEDMETVSRWDREGSKFKTLEDVEEFIQKEIIRSNG